MKFENLTIGFDNKVILSSLSGRLSRGKLVALMGRNGVGKSCLLKTLSLILDPLSGQITIDQNNIKNMTAAERSKHLAIVLTDKIDVDYLTVDEILKMARSPYTGWSGKLSENDEAIIAQTTKLLNLETIKEKFFADLSDGLKQKVMTARALIQEPQLLFLDEPTTFLDIPAKKELMKLLKLLTAEKNYGVLFSTHDWELAKNVVDEVWLIDLDKKLQILKPEAVEASGLFKKTFDL